MTNFPPIDWEDLYAMGLPQGTALHSDDGMIAATPGAPALLLRLLREAAKAAPPTQDRVAYLRHVRDLLMGLTDWTQAADSPLSEEQRAAWANYRQALRDLPQTYSGGGPISWPVAPS